MSRISAKSSPGKYSLVEKPIHCPHCEGDQFIAGEAQLNTALMTLFELDWIDKKAAILTCTSCGRIQWFAKPPTRDS